MKKWITTGILAGLVIGMVLMSGCTSTAPVATPTPTPQIVYVTVLVTQAPTPQTVYVLVPVQVSVTPTLKQSSKIVGMTLTQNSAGYGVATITGGPDLNSLLQVNVSIAGDTEAVLLPAGSIAVGKSATTAKTVAGKRVMLIGYFNDGSSQMLIDKQF